MSGYVKSMMICLAAALASVAHASDWSNSGKITQIYPHVGYGVILIRHTGQTNPDSCSSTAWSALPRTHEMYKELYALILAAAMADAEISFHLSGCTSQGHPAIRHALMPR